MIDPSPSPPVSPRIILLPASRFFVRVVPLAAEGDRTRQIELALESRSSFPVSQLYYGYVLAPGGDAALVYAAYRKRFSPAETAGWSEATAVLPAFLALLAPSPTKPTIRLWTDGPEITALAWDGTNPLPVALMARENTGPADAAPRAGLLAEIGGRTEQPDAIVQDYSGPVTVRPQAGQGEWELLMAGGAVRLASALEQARMETADVRDKEFLRAQKTLRRRDAMLWRGFQVCLAALAVLLVWEAGLWAASARVSSLRQQAQQQAPGVGKIETAQALSRRIAEMTERRLLPFEMLALVNRSRPPSIQFMRSVTTGLYAMDIEAQTANAAEVSQYEAALRALPQLASVETRDLRSRDGVTTFVLAVVCKPGLLRPEGAP